MSANLVKYETEHGEVILSDEIVKRFLVSGDPANVTTAEVKMFLEICKYQKLNPFLREVYLIKFGGSRATIVVGKDVFVKRASADTRCNGWKSGIVVKGAGGAIEYREGSLVFEGEELIGGWAEVYRKDWTVPIRKEVSLTEYKRYKENGEPMANWKNMEATMIAKVPLCQALREAIPEKLSTLYDISEMPVDSSQLSNEPVKAVEAVPVDSRKEEIRKAIREMLVSKLINQSDIVSTIAIVNPAIERGEALVMYKQLTEPEAEDLLNRLKKFIEVKECQNG